MKGSFDIRRYWSAFLHWKGWRVFGSWCVRGWKTTVSWPFWRMLFRIPVSLAALLCLVCGAGLVWVFLTGRDQWVPAYFLYALSFYALTALCVKLPAGLRAGKNWLDRHPRINGLLHNGQWKFTTGLYFEQLINFGYGFFKVVSGVLYQSAWIGADGIYNVTQGLIQLFQILRRKNPGTLSRQWQSYRLCGVLILLMHLTMTGLVFQMVNWNRAEEYPGTMIFATAAFAFYKLINSFLDVAKDRKHTHPVDSSVRMLNLSQAIFSLFSLQVSLLHTFGTGEGWEKWMNLGTGSAACLLVMSMGIYMIRRGNREIRKLQENPNGK